MDISNTTSLKFIAIVTVVLLASVSVFYFSPSVSKVDIFRSAYAAFIVFCFVVDVRYGLITLVFGFMLAHFLGTQPSLANTQTGIVDAAIAEQNRRDISVESIPRTIVQIWIEKDPMNPLGIPSKEMQYADRLRKMNPDFNYLFFDASDVEPFFTKLYPEYYSTYKRLPLFIQKMDFFRYLILYHYGGFYFDMDVSPILPLDAAICGHNAVFPVDEYIVGNMVNRPRFAPIAAKGQQFLIGQYAFGCVARNPFLKLAIDKIHANVDNYIQTVNDSEVYVYRSTGPDFMTNLYSGYDNKSAIYILANGKRQMFGDYARHEYSGNWKIQWID
jgi:mannosyltransferase OCH1-like enzyme